MKSIVAQPLRVRRRLARVCQPIACETLEGRRLLSAGLPTGLSNGGDLPRPLPPGEREYLKRHQLNDNPPEPPPPPPTGPIDPIAEWEPMEGLVISWVSQPAILTQMTKRVTDAGGRMYINVFGAGASSEANATAALQSAGVNMANVTFRQYGFNSVWIRDY